MCMIPKSVLSSWRYTPFSNSLLGLGLYSWALEPFLKKKVDIHEHIRTVFRAMLSQAIIAKMIKMAIMAVMEWHNMATNMAVIGVYGKSRINADSP